jgi:hypothetical protein
MLMRHNNGRIIVNLLARRSSAEQTTTAPPVLAREGYAQAVSKVLSRATAGPPTSSSFAESSSPVSLLHSALPLSSARRGDGTSANGAVSRQSQPVRFVRLRLLSLQSCAW